MTTLNILLIILASLSILMAIMIIVGYVIDSKLEHFQKKIIYMVNCVLEQISEEYGDD